ncbi:MAG: epoxyqueuosine reductase QueH [Alphaproteobacteria bacterium]|nr:epoxyqueuosine reductase QueH [Alphaproteobacteria bacterium]
MLLHICCSPCAVEAVDRMVSHDIVVQLYFYNPNITNPDEYQKRLKEVQKLADFYKLPLFEDVYNPKDFLCSVKGFENEPEKGKRCDLCFQMRLKRLKNYAQDHKIAYTTSVLGVSRWKDFNQTVRAATESFLSANGTSYLPINWRKEDSEPKRLALIKERDIYEQNYCGCPFSKS